MVMPWRTLLEDLLASGTHATQGSLVRALTKAGHAVDQATVSRHLSAIGARKVGGAWRPAPAPHVGAPVHAFHTTAADCLAVVHTDPAFAGVLAQAIDDAAIPGVLGTLGGEDTVFVATAGPASTRQLRTFLGLGSAASRRRTR
jgi:transcriptional regulator of arginine metabolism